MDNLISQRLNLFIPEVLSIVTEETRKDILDFIHLSAVSLDFRFVVTEEDAKVLVSDSLGYNVIQSTSIFVENLVRYAKMEDPSHDILKFYFNEAIIPVLLKDYLHIVAAAYLNYGHGAAIAIGFMDAINSALGRRNSEGNQNVE